MDSILVKYDLSAIRCFDEADGPGDAEPYLWTAFFKIDGDTVLVNENLELQGKATVVTTPGNHGNLGDTDVDEGDTVVIPSKIGQFQTMLRPIPVVPSPGTVVGGHIGCVAVLMEEDSTPGSAVAAGHNALNKALEDELNKIIPTLGIGNQEVTDEEKKKLEKKIGSAVESAIKSKIDGWDIVWGLISFGNSQDDKIGSAVFDFSHKSLEAKAGQSISLHKKWNSEGSWEIRGKVSVTKRLYDAIWRPVGGSETQIYGWRFKDFKSRYDKLWKDNWRLDVFNTYEENGRLLHDAVWRPTGGGEIQYYGVTFKNFKAKYDQLWKDNWRLHIFNTYTRNGQRLHDAVWKQTGGGEIQFYGTSFKQFDTKHKELWKDNWRLHIFNSYVENGKLLHDAVWRPTGGGEIAVFGWKYNDFRAKYDQLWKDNWRLQIFNTYTKNGQRLHDAVWKPTGGGEIQVYGWGYSDFRKKYDELWGGKWRLEILNAHHTN